MTNVMFIVMMQFLISAKAGLVNYVQGTVSARPAHNVEIGQPVATGPNGRMELLLNPGSFLRIGPNSEVRLESSELTNISLRLVSGSAVIEATDVGKKNPITVHTGSMTAEIIQEGIYLFDDHSATVIKGKLRSPQVKDPIGKGWQLYQAGDHVATLFVGKQAPTESQEWSRARSEKLSLANSQLRVNPAFRPTIAANSWMFVPGIAAFTFMPLYPYRSPYGYEYRSIFVGQPGYYGHGPSTGAAASAGSASPGTSGTGSPSAGSPGVGAGGAGGTMGRSTPTMVERKTSLGVINRP